MQTHPRFIPAEYQTRYIPSEEDLRIKKIDLRPAPPAYLRRPSTVCTVH